jgi:oligoribonuclease
MSTGQEKYDHLIWIDLEMSGLDPNRDKILEMATIVTDPFLNVVAEGPVFVIHQSTIILEGMDEWNTTHHTTSGLVDKVKKSDVSEAQAEEEMITFLKAHVPAGYSPMCGNSICQDRRFLYQYMPRLEAFFHYRNIDVSTIKELARRWKPAVYEQVKKMGKHEALEDIKESIQELRLYQDTIFNKPVS